MYLLKLQHISVQQLKNKWSVETDLFVNFQCYMCIKLNALTSGDVCKISHFFYFSVDSIDENQMVFIDNSNGEDSIELVNHSMESSSELSTERKDIVEVNNIFALLLRPFNLLINQIFIGEFSGGIILQKCCLSTCRFQVILGIDR